MLSWVERVDRILHPSVDRFDTSTDGRVLQPSLSVLEGCHIPGILSLITSENLVLGRFSDKISAEVVTEYCSGVQCGAKRLECPKRVNVNITKLLRVGFKHRNGFKAVVQGCSTKPNISVFPNLLEYRKHLQKN